MALWLYFIFIFKICGFIVLKSKSNSTHHAQLIWKLPFFSILKFYRMRERLSWRVIYYSQQWAAFAEIYSCDRFSVRTSTSTCNRHIGEREYKKYIHFLILKNMPFKWAPTIHHVEHNKLWFNIFSHMQHIFLF